jgi:hypothetical protein
MPEKMSRRAFVGSGHPPRQNAPRFDEADEEEDFNLDDDVDMAQQNASEDEDEHRKTDINISANPAKPENGLVLGEGQTIKLMLVPEGPPAAAAPGALKKEEKPHPQTKMKKFWKNFDPEFSGKVTRILPERITEKDLSSVTLAGEIAHQANKSYEDAKQSCIRDVKRIIKECRIANQKYTDSHWDIERDLKITRMRDCLDGLVIADDDKEYPADAKRVTDIYDRPQFYVDGPSYDDILQGSVGDCWFLAAISSLGCNKDFIDRVCVIQDQAVGVYGFVFHRDGEWHQCIIDDKLYLRAPAYDESGDVVLTQYGIRRTDQEDQYQDLFQRGSKALYFAQCRDQNETWVSLLEKAYAKAHGDYASIAGGQTGEAIEDLTGGVTTEIYTTNILDTDEFWKNELSRIGKDFVFSCAVARWREWRPYLLANEKIREERRSGIVSQHAYAVLNVYEGHGQRLVKIRNPWGRKEWTGAWSDGSKEWTAEWMTRLNHQFDDDGIFWMSYKDMLSKYKYIDRTRIFGPGWHVAQQWMSVQVPWSALDYQTNHFSIDVPEDTDAIIVLSQLDDRYFKGLQGKYNFTMQFRVQRDDDNEEEYLSRSKLTYELIRSTNVEVHLTKGTYTVLVKVEAHSTSRGEVESVIRNSIHRRDKITQIGKLYDLAHQKGQLPSATTPTSNSSGTSTPIPGPATPATMSRTPSTQSSTSSPTTKTSNTIEEPSDDKDPDRNPWNASCVIGVRVYSRQPDLGLKVIVPGEDDPPHIIPTLDRDDVAKSALGEVKAVAEKCPDVMKDGDGEGKKSRVGSVARVVASNEADGEDEDESSDEDEDD